MVQQDTQKISPFAIRMNKVRTFFSKPYNVILLIFGIILTITTVAPMDSPLKKKMMILVIIVVEPTAAKACVLTKFPTTSVSTVL